MGFIPEIVDPRPVLPGQKGATIRRSRLLEVSSVAVPACPECRVTAKCCGHVPRLSGAEIATAIETAFARETVRMIFEAAFKRALAKRRE
jgi:hypothetical protein